MPVVRVSVSAGVLAHRRNKYAVRKRHIPNRERIKQVSHGLYTASLNLLFDASVTAETRKQVRRFLWNFADRCLVGYFDNLRACGSLRQELISHTPHRSKVFGAGRFWLQFLAQLQNVVVDRATDKTRIPTLR